MAPIFTEMGRYSICACGFRLKRCSNWTRMHTTPRVSDCGYMIDIHTKPHSTMSNSCGQFRHSGTSRLI
jgi:hypothetical protein